MIELNVEDINIVSGGCQVGNCWPDPLNPGSKFLF